jgi:hypothetical protein
MLFRQSLLSITLDIEHSLKVNLNKTISEDVLEDGYKITNEFLIQNKKVQNKIAEIKKYKNSNAYVYDLVNKYEKDFASWNLVEILTFGDLIFFYDFYTSKKQTKNDFDFLLRYIKFARNAAAHNNCMLNQLHTKGFKNTPSKKLQNIIKANLPQITSTGINKNISIPVLYDILATKSPSFNFIYGIGFVYLNTFKSLIKVRLIIPFCVNTVIYLFVLKSVTGITSIIFSSGLILIILLTCLPKSFHFISGISYTGTYK